MAVWTCAQCEKEFKRAKSGARPIRFCSFACYKVYAKAHPNKGTFKSENIPWNHDKKGIHLSPASEWKKGAAPCGRDHSKWVPVGTIRTRRTKNGVLRKFIKITEPNKWKEYAVYVWENHHKTTLPNGCVVHHKDRNPLNDSEANLQMMTRAEHMNEHRNEIRSV